MTTPDNLAAAVELKWYENQDWTGLSGAQAFQIIERHAEGWTEIDEAMAAWLKANQRPPVAGLAELTDEQWFKLFARMHLAHESASPAHTAKDIATAARAYLAALPKNAQLSASPGERDGVITQRELEHALNCLSVDAAMNTPDFELAEKLFERAKAFKDYEADMAKIGYI